MAEADPTLKRLIDTSSPDWARWMQRVCGVPEGPFAVESPNLSTKADADRVFRVELPTPRLIDCEPEASRQELRPERYLKFSVLLSDKTGLPVTTVAVVLCKAADSPDLTGTLEKALDGVPYMNFSYRVVRVWERPVEEFLEGDVGLLPLAPLAVRKKGELKRVVHRMAERLKGEPPGVVGEIFGITRVLMGVRFPSMLIKSLLQGVSRMESSIVYQEILGIGMDKGRVEGRDEGRIEGSVEANRKMVLYLAGKKLGTPTKGQRSRLDRIGNADRLFRMVEHLEQNATWDDLLQVK